MRASAGRQTIGRQGRSVPPWIWAVLVGLVIGFGLGVFYAWMINPVVLTDVDPVDLRQDWKEVAVLMAADSYALRRNPELVRAWFSTFPREEVQSLITRLHNSTTNAEEQRRFQELAAALNIQIGAELPEATPTPTPAPRRGAGGLVRSFLTVCAIGLLLLLLIVAAGILFTRWRVLQRRRAGELREGRPRYQPPRPTPAGAPGFPPAEGETGLEGVGMFGEYEEQVMEEELQAEPRPDTGPMPAVAEARLGQFTTRYQFGDDDYDMSFSIETPDGTFLGECGVSISEILLEEPKQHVTAFEVWLFDKDDIRTATKVLLSEYAWQDETLQNKLKERGELVLARPGETFELETESLRVRVRVRAMEYGTTPQLPPKSFFSRLELDLEPMRKTAGGGIRY